VLAATIASGHAHAQAVASTNGDGFDTHLFRPAMDSKGLFTVNGTEIIGANEVSIGLTIDYGRNLLRVNDVGQRSPQLLNHSFQGTAMFNYGIANRLTVGLAVPVNLMAGNEQFTPTGSPVLTGWGPGQVDSQTLGFIGLHSKLRLLRVDKGLGVSLGMQLGVPVTSAPRDAGADPGFFYWPQLILEKRIGDQEQFKIAVNGGFRGHMVSATTLQLRNGTFKDGNRLTYGAGLSYRLLEPLDLVAETYGTVLFAPGVDTSVGLSNELIGGIKLFVEKNSFLMLGAGARYTQGFEAADVRGVVGFIFEPSIGDRDSDGIKDDIDKCPDDPEDKDGFEDEDGCPDLDNDKDKIPDYRDHCPNDPEDYDGDRDKDGCPEPTDGDRDHDGILDSKDKCPDEPEDKDGFEDEDGCPDPDNDKDGIPDVKDKCPNDPEDKDGFEDEDGCPEPDNDKDGIPDIHDKCPNQPETFNDVDDEDGCPDDGKLIIKGNTIVILEKIQFATGSAVILPRSFTLLDAVSKTLNLHTDFALVEVAGHADERDGDANNVRLTQNRVNSVVKALVQRKVDEKRLRGKGYGEYCPEDSGHNEKAWEKNRRVEFKIVKTKDGPTGVELGCENATKHGVAPDAVQ
jgi:outer membrane protein OmpA-like peptidoglycan-associated protein